MRHDTWNKTATKKAREYNNNIFICNIYFRANLVVVLFLLLIVTITIINI